MDTDLSRVDLVDHTYRDVLFREPYPDERTSAPTSAEALRESLLASREYQRVVRPLLAEIEGVYRKFLFREARWKDYRRHLDRFRRKARTLDVAEQIVDQERARVYLGIRPFKVIMDLTTRCNLRCVMCHFSNPEVYNRKGVDMALEDFERLAAQIFPLTQKVSLSAGAEPLMNADFDAFLGLLASYEIPMVCMNTNGLLLTEKTMQLLVGSKFHTVTVSLDAATAATYERIRRGSSFEKVIANIQTLQRMKLQVGADRPDVCLSYTIMRSNLRELPSYVKLGHELGIRRLYAHHVVPYKELDNDHESVAYEKELCNEMLDEAQRLAKRFEISLMAPDKFTLNAPTAAEPPPPNGSISSTPAPPIQLLKQWADLEPLEISLSVVPTTTPRPLREWAGSVDLPLADDDTVSCCPYPWHFLAITAQGDILPCCWWHGEDTMGNILRQSFEDIWNNARYSGLRAELMSGALRATCQSCPNMGIGSVDHAHAFSVRPMRT